MSAFIYQEVRHNSEDGRFVVVSETSRSPDTGNYTFRTYFVNNETGFIGELSSIKSTLMKFSPDNQCFVFMENQIDDTGVAIKAYYIANLNTGAAVQFFNDRDAPLEDLDFSIDGSRLIYTQKILRSDDGGYHYYYKQQAIYVPTVPQLTHASPSGSNISDGNGILTVGHSVQLTVGLVAIEKIIDPEKITLTLNNGGVALYDAAASVAGKTLVFNYTVQTDQSALDLAIVSVDLNGATLNGVGGRAVLLDNALLDIEGKLGIDGYFGTSADETFFGTTGIETFRGNAGSDTYFVNDVNDIVIEMIDDGRDTVITAVSYKLATGQQIEILQTAEASGIANLRLTGNEFTNKLVGNAGANTLDGGAGADVMEGGAGNDSFIVDQAGDRVFETSGGGTDRVFASASYALQAGQEIEGLQLLAATRSANLNLTGNEISQSLVGNNGANVIDGGIGRDAMTGRGGNDTYLVDNLGDRITEAAGGGRDTVLTRASYSLGSGQEIEALQLLAVTGTARLNLSGNEFGQSVVGNNGANVLDGKGGADVLTGRGGADSFLFSTALSAGNVDRITDFAVEDTIRLSKSIFSAIAPGQLAGGAFKTVAAISTAKLDADDRIVYKQTTGELFYDADGSGASAAVKFAVLDNKAGMTAADFLIV